MTILVGNFNIDLEEWISTAEITHFAVDVVDLSYAITSGTYFLQDGVAVTTSLSGIPSGYRAYHYPTTTISGPTMLRMTTLMCKNNRLNFCTVIM